MNRGILLFKVNSQPTVPLGRRHSPVDLSTYAYHPAARVRIPSTPSTLSNIVKFVLYLSCEKNENK